MRALELFLDDVYGDQNILAAAACRRRSSLGAKHYLPSCAASSRRAACASTSPASTSIRDPGRARSASSRTTCGRRRACRYVLENRLVTKRVFPHVFDAARVRRVDHYPTRLAETLRSVSPGRRRRRHASSCSRPGPYNSAYFEHSFLARTMGVELVAGAGPVRRRRPGLRAHDARAAARRRHLPPHRRRLPRPRGVPPRQHARRARPDARLRARATSRSPTRPATASPTTRRSTRSCRT